MQPKSDRVLYSSGEARKEEKLLETRERVGWYNLEMRAKQLNDKSSGGEGFVFFSFSGEAIDCIAVFRLKSFLNFQKLFMTETVPV